MVYRQGTGRDIFDTFASRIVIPVNCVSVMGRGLAQQWKMRYRTDFMTYQDMCRDGRLRIGTVQRIGFYIMFPTKQDWRNPSEINYIKQSLDALYELISIEDEQNAQIAIPKVGCGAGGLDWQDVQPLIIDFAERLDKKGVDVLQY